MNVFKRARTSTSVKGKESPDSKRGRSKSLASVGRQESILLHSKKEALDLIKTIEKDFTVSKSIIDFGLGDNPCPVNLQVEDSIIIANHTKKKIKYKLESSAKKGWKLAFEPASGIVPPMSKKKRGKKITVKMTLLTPQSMDEKINLTINGKESIFLTIKAHVAQGVYGVNPIGLDFVVDHGFRVPLILAQMREFLVSQNALRVEGIFRLAGNATEMQGIKDRMNAGHAFKEEDAEINAIANLIKVWYRELPEPLLNSLPTEVICNSLDMEACVHSLNALTELDRVLLSWLIDLLADVAEFKDVNKMTEQNLAIVVAPNLYNPPSQDPMEGLVLSQKSTQFLQNLILFELENRAEAKKTGGKVEPDEAALNWAIQEKGKEKEKESESEDTDDDEGDTEDEGDGDGGEEL